MPSGSGDRDDICRAARRNEPVGMPDRSRGSRRRFAADAGQQVEEVERLAEEPVGPEQLEPPQVAGVHVGREHRPRARRRSPACGPAGPARSRPAGSGRARPRPGRSRPSPAGRRPTTRPTRPRTRSAVAAVRSPPTSPGRPQPLRRCAATRPPVATAASAWLSNWGCPSCSCGAATFGSQPALASADGNAAAPHIGSRPPEVQRQSCDNRGPESSAKLDPGTGSPGATLPTGMGHADAPGVPVPAEAGTPVATLHVDRR